MNYLINLLIVNTVKLFMNFVPLDLPLTIYFPHVQQENDKNSLWSWKFFTAFLK